MYGIRNECLTIYIVRKNNETRFLDIDKDGDKKSL